MTPMAYWIMGALAGFGTGLGLGVLACLWLYERGPRREKERT